MPARGTRPAGSSAAGRSAGDAAGRDPVGAAIGGGRASPCRGCPACSIAVGDTPLIELHPAAVGIIVRALREVGEDEAARLFAIETAIAHGL